MRRLVIILGTVALMVVSSAHVGSPDTWFEGAAGPYPVRVLVRAPEVIPGLADVTIWPTGDGVKKVWATPAYYNAGDRGLPPPDTARAVPGQPGAYALQLWIMSPGSYSVRVTVNGAAGTGTAVVPISAAAFRVRQMDTSLGLALAGAGLFLIVGLVTIVGAATRESVLADGEEPSLRHRRRARVAMGVASAIIVGLLWGGKLWWDAEDQAYRRGLGRPWRAETALVGTGAARRLHLTIPDSLWRERWVSPLVPDHGKLMHLFLADERGEAFAHLHPIALDSANFETTLPPLPGGKYRVYADVTHETGFARTIISSVTLPADLAPDSAAATSLDPDDSWRVGPAADTTASLPDGASLVWEHRGPIHADQEAGLRFTVREPDGSAGTVEPYLGMAGHAVVMREDGGVFIHLHPMGTISAAAQVVLTERTTADSTRGALSKRLADAGLLATHPGGLGSAHSTRMSGTFAFPYAFPDTGAYRVWVQVKRNGKVETVTFRTVVSSAS